MRLSVLFPASEASNFPTVLAPAHAAPMCTLERHGSVLLHHVVFPDLHSSLDVAISLMAELSRLEIVQITIDGRSVESLVKFWSALECYRESLEEPDPRLYCDRQARRLEGAAGCQNWACLVRCQYICSRCHGVAIHEGSPPVNDQLLQIARQAEVDWCPNLRLPVHRDKYTAAPPSTPPD